MDKDLAYLVSNIDLQKKFKATPDKIMIKLYPELNDTEDIMDILPSDVCVCFILLKTSEQSGHWTCLCRNGNCIYYFDSYGVIMLAPLVSGRSMLIICPSSDENDILTVSCSQVLNP